MREVKASRRGVLTPAFRFSTLTILLSVLATPIWPASIDLNSGSDPTGSLQWNSVGGFGTANTIITPNPVWEPPTGGAAWVSFENTGFEALVAGNSGAFGAPSVNPTASFFQRFTLPLGGASTGGITVWSDDTAQVYIDSNLAFPVQTSAADAHCVTGAIGCGSDEGGFVSLAGLAPGTHTIRFDVWQLGGDSFGLLYKGQVANDPGVGGTGDPSSAPEPATYALIAGGLLGLGVYRRFRA